MEYHILNVAGRLAVAPSRNALLLVTCLLAVACNFSISPAVRQARREVDHHFEFIRPVTGGFDIASCTGSMVRTVRVPNPSRIRSFTPDYSGFVLSQAEWESESTLRLSVKVKDIPNITWEVVEECRTQIFGDPADLRYEGAEGIAVCVRVLDSCELERQVTIIKRQSRPSELRAITTVTPLRKQLTSIRAEKPEADDETVCRSVTVQSYAPSNTVVHEVTKLSYDGRGFLRSAILHSTAQDVSWEKQTRPTYDSNGTPITCLEGIYHGALRPFS